MADLPVTLGAMEAVPPGIRYRIRDVLDLLPKQGGALDGVPAERLARLLDEGEPGSARIRRSPRSATG